MLETDQSHEQSMHAFITNKRGFKQIGAIPHQVKVKHNMHPSDTYLHAYNSSLYDVSARKRTQYMRPGFSQRSRCRG